jgi:hypothetical protein
MKGISFVTMISAEQGLCLPHTLEELCGFQQKFYHANGPFGYGTCSVSEKLKRGSEKWTQCGLNQLLDDKKRHCWVEYTR